MMYASHTMTTESVAAKELRQHLAEHLDGVLAGRSYEITRNNRVTARLVPADLEENTDAEDD
jgi:prevent-host-death family protein